MQKLLNYFCINRILTFYILLKSYLRVCSNTYLIDSLDIKNKQNQAKRVNICVILNVTNV